MSTPGWFVAEQPAIPASAAPKVLLGLIAAAWLYVSPYFPAINNPNENVRFYMTAALVEEGTYQIDVIRARWGWVNDAAVYEGRTYSVKAPGTSFLGVPGYAAYVAVTRALGRELDRDVALRVVRITGSVLPNLAFVVYFAVVARRWSRSAVLADLVTWSLALGSCLFGYALLFVSHTTSAACAFAAFALLMEARRTRVVSARASFFAGLLTAGVTFFEYPGLVASVLLALHACVALRPVRRLAAFALGGAIPTVLTMHFQWRAFGNPLSPGHLHVENPAFRAIHETGFFGATGFHTDAARHLLFDLGAGLFPSTPLWSFAVVGVVALLRARAVRLDALVALAIVVATFVAICFMDHWRGGWTIGPRYLAGVVPFVAFFALAGIATLSRHAPRITLAVAVAATLASVFPSTLPSAYYPQFPPEVANPFADVVRVLIAHDYAPWNLGRAALGLEGTPSMIPFFALLAGALMAAMLGDAPRIRPLALALGLVAGAGALAWEAGLESPLPEVIAARAFVTRNWSPPGDDRASRLETELRARSTDADRAGRVPILDALTEIYREEGREREAAVARAQRERLVPRE